MEHGLKYTAFYVKKTYNTLHSCHNFPAGSSQAARGARICETSLLDLQEQTSVKLQPLWSKDLSWMCVWIFCMQNGPYLNTYLQL